MTRRGMMRIVSSHGFKIFFCRRTLKNSANKFYKLADSVKRGSKASKFKIQFNWTCKVDLRRIHYITFHSNISCAVC